MHIVDELEMKTQAYWALSQVWNGRIERKVTTSQAINQCNGIMFQLNPYRPLSVSAWKLQEEIIQRPRTKKPKNMPQPISMQKYREVAND